MQKLERAQAQIEASSVSEDERSRLYQETGRQMFAGYDPAAYRWSVEPPPDGLCLPCYVWRRYPLGQRHFGFTWFRVCEDAPPPWGCRCAHHETETWWAGTGGR